MRTSCKRCWAEVDLAALERNVGRIRAALPQNVQYIAVVKADAYGHGLPYVTPRLMQSFVDGFAVANVFEGMTIRELGAGWPILVLSPVLPDEELYVIDFDLIPIVSSVEEIKRFDALGRANGKMVKIHLKIDTGMGRLGILFPKRT